MAGQDKGGGKDKRVEKKGARPKGGMGRPRGAGDDRGMPQVLKVLDFIRPRAGGSTVGPISTMPAVPCILGGARWTSSLAGPRLS